MQHYRVSDMTCAHCASTIEQAVKSVDSHAIVSADLAQHQVSVETRADRARIAQAIRSAGYENEPITI